jgi:hypothetical protein
MMLVAPGSLYKQNHPDILLRIVNELISRRRIDIQKKRRNLEEELKSRRRVEIQEAELTEIQKEG